MDDKILISRITEEINRLKVPKNEIAEKTGYTPQTLTNITKGRNQPSVNFLYRIKASFPSFDINYIFTGNRGDGEKVDRMKQELERERAIVSRLLGKSDGEVKRPGDSVMQRRIKHNANSYNERYALQMHSGLRRSIGKTK